MEKTLPLIITTTILLTLFASVTAIYLTISLTNTGTIVAHGCKVYLEDKTTESYTINWNEMTVNQTITKYRWLYNNSTVTEGINLSWHHNAASYLSLKTYYELPSHAWQELPQNQQKVFNQGEWLHIKLELTALLDAINHQGAFNFNIFIELA